ncbi:unnamed protein product [Sphacelaria rigidula]
MLIRANRKGFPHGIRSLQLPIKVKNGPQTVILLKANVTSPEVVLSHEEVDFDNVLIGQSKIKYIQVKSIVHTGVVLISCL